jgi:hypothetical protein
LTNLSWWVPFSNIENIILLHAKISRGFVKNPSQNHIWDKEVGNNHTKTLDHDLSVEHHWNRFHTRLNNFIRTFLPNICRCQACNPTVWYFSGSHSCIVVEPRWCHAYCWSA